MLVRKCSKCGVVWRSELTQCAFCGHETAEPPATAVAVLERPVNGRSQPQTPPPAVASPEPANPAPAEAPARITDARPSPAETPARNADARPSPAEASARSAEAKAGPSPKEAAPSLPSANVPLVFAFLGLAAAALLPAGAWVVGERTASILVFLGVALLAPFAPLAWWTGGRYAERCDVLGFRPAGAARAGRGMGVAVTLLLAAEGSALAFLQALQHLQS